jgi:hypothetical protein
MLQRLPNGPASVRAPQFYLTGRQPLRPGPILLAIVVAAIALCSVSYGLGHGRRLRFGSEGSDVDRSAGGSATKSSADNDKDDPNQIDTIVLGDPADAPVPGRKGDHVSPVHPTIVVHLPRFGDQVGLIPNSPAGRLLYGWLAAFNQADFAALSGALPNDALDSAAAAQIELRKQTGGFNLLSAKEVLPGVLVFRLRDQTRDANEVLGTLQVGANSSPPVLASFSLRAVPGMEGNEPRR